MKLALLALVALTAGCALVDTPTAPPAYRYCTPADTATGTWTADGYVVTAQSCLTH